MPLGVLGGRLCRVVVEGYEEGRIDYSVGNTSGSRLTYWDVAAGFGHRVGPLSVGVTGHYIRPGTVMRSRMYEPQIDLEREEIEVNYLSVRARGGSGYALDFGAALQPSPALTISGSISSAVSKLTWSDELLVRDFVLDRSTIDTMGVLNLAKAYSATEETLDPSTASLRALQMAERLYDDAHLPATAHLGADWKPLATTNPATPSALTHFPIRAL